MIESLQSDVLNRILQKTNGIPLPGKTSSPHQIRPILKNSQSIAVTGNQILKTIQDEEEKEQKYSQEQPDSL